MPRLADFAKREPRVELRVFGSSKMVDAGGLDSAALVGNLDLRDDMSGVEIHLGGGTYPGYRADHLFDVATVAVASPELARGDLPLEQPEDLARHVLLHDDAMDLIAHGSAWQKWLEAAGVADCVDGSHGPHFSSNILSLEAASAKAGNEKLYLYRGADRDQRLLENARREGVIVIYTSLAPSESVPLTQSFEKKHGIKVELWRSASEKVTQRAITEARARRFSVDAVETIGTDLERMTREKIFAEFHSPHLADLIPAAIPRHRAWFPDRLSYLGVAYNTKLVRREDLPGTYEGFLDPKWRGKLGIEASDIAWLAGIVKFWGEDRGMRFFERLAVLKPDVRPGHTLLTQLVAAGDVPVGPTIYSSGVVHYKRAVAPSDWMAVVSVVGQPIGIALAKNA